MRLFSISMHFTYEEAAIPFQFKRYNRDFIGFLMLYWRNI
jgi:hypothetical protein